MMKSAAGGLNALHGRLAALSGERLLLRDFTEVTFHIVGSHEPKGIHGIYVCVTNVAHYFKY